MQPELIKITEYCISYDISPSFLHSLEETGIITLTVIGEDQFIHVDQLIELERYIHLHYDLEINMEGMDAIRHLLLRLEELQQQIHHLKNEIQLHDSPGQDQP